MLEKLKKFKWGYIILFLLLLGLGICLIALKETLVALAITIGCTVAVFGIVWGPVAIAKKERGFGFAIKIAFASMCLISGVVAAIFRDQSIEIIIAISSLLLIVDASFKIRTTAMAKRYSVPLWWIILSLSVITIVGGFILLKYTPERIDVSSIFLGIVFIVDSVSNLLSAFYVAAYEKREKAEHYREFYSREIAPRAKAALECEEAKEEATEEQKAESENGTETEAAAEDSAPEAPAPEAAEPSEPVPEVAKEATKSTEHNES